MRILVSNDDGVHAEGINTLADALRGIGEVIVVAPDRNRSGASNSLSLDRPLRTREISDNVISVEGTPTDCVHIAITGLLDKLPDIVVSGINEGANLGDDVWYSGTVAAAVEGRLLGLPAIALSLAGETQQYYDTAAKIAVQLVERLLKEPLPDLTMLNVNVPNLPHNQLQGMEVTRMGTRHRAEQTIQQLDPRGKPIYWIGPVGPEHDARVGTDFHAIHAKKVSVTPLRVDLTNYEAFNQVADWVTGLTTNQSIDL